MSAVTDSQPIKPKILIVDDSPDNLQVLMQLLKEDYAIVAATTGEKALQLAVRTPVPDLIILDVVMPVMDGYEVCTCLKANPDTQGIPVVFVSALNEVGNETRGFELGAIDYIIKPFSPPVVKARIKSHLTIQRLNQELQQTNSELARATRMKDEFLANMSHELRTPLNAILGMVEGLQEGVFGDVNQGQIKALQTIERSGSHLLALINDILDLAKIEAGKLVLDFAPTAIAPLCQSSLAFVKQQAHQKGISVETKLPPHLPDLAIDERRIRQVLINLLNNAVKFTPEGGRITLEVSLPPAQTHLMLRIAVIDTGIGIAPENIEKLFQPFIQIDSALNRQYTGTGLGLALVRRIVELHGGQVGLTSKVGVGSCFTIDLPVSQTSDEEQRKVGAIPPWLPQSTGAEEQRSRGAGTRIGIAPPSVAQESPLILLAEDNEANISTISSYLTAKGYRLVLAKTGHEAIATAKSAQPDVILMDIQMPGMDGFEAMKQIRSNRTLADVPIVALTALAMAGDREKCLAAGANDYLSKPVKLKQLTNIIQQLLAVQKNKQ
jgi:signal transduction histidine kinase